MSGNDILNDRKSKAGSGRFGGKKWSKDVFYLLFGYAATGILNPDVDLVIKRPGFQSDGPRTVD